MNIALNVHIFNNEDRAMDKMYIFERSGDERINSSFNNGASIRSSSRPVSLGINQNNDENNNKIYGANLNNYKADGFPTNIFENNIKFLDTKCNNIMDGEFTKIIFSDENVTLNGLYLMCPLYNSNKNNGGGGGGGGGGYGRTNSFGSSSVLSQEFTINSSHSTHFMNERRERLVDKNKNILYIQPNNPLNIPIIHQFILFEQKLLEYYKLYSFCTKNPVFLLQNQLLSGSVKIYRDFTENTINENLSVNVRYVIKISGIWETADTFGITYKFLEMYEK